MKKILITGAAGHIGSSLAFALLNNSNYYVVGIDNLSTGSIDNLPKHINFKFIKADANDFQDMLAIFSAHFFDYVFHFAAVVGVQRTVNNPLLVLSDIDGIRNILSISKNFNVKRVFFSSSSEVYGEPVTLPQNEATTPLNSRLPYAIVKNVCEAYLKSYNKEHGLQYTIFRFFNTYGPRQSVDFVISRFLQYAMSNLDITIYGDGLQTRTFCYIDDNIDTMVKCFEGDLFVNDILNVGSNLEYTILDAANMIKKLTHSKSNIVFMPKLKEGDMTRRMPDINKMMSVLGRPLITLEDGIGRIIKSNNFIS